MPVSWGANMTGPYRSCNQHQRHRRGCAQPCCRLAAPRQPAGQLSLRTDVELSLYSAQRQQYGLRFRPAWRHTIGPVLLTLNHDLRLTDSGSPFTTTLDRLTPINRTVFQARLQDVEVSPDLRFSSTFRIDYNWVRFASGDRRGVEDQLLSGSFDWQPDAGSWQVRWSRRCSWRACSTPSSARAARFIEGSLSARQNSSNCYAVSILGTAPRPAVTEFHAAYPLEFTGCEPDTVSGGRSGTAVGRLARTCTQRTRPAVNGTAAAAYPSVSYCARRGVHHLVQRGVHTLMPNCYSLISMA